jgi:hypothetical protein
MPLHPDVVFFDICARTLLRGGTLYRDVFLHNVPGRVLAGTAIRACLGWSSVALRAADFLIVAVIIWLLVSRVQPTRLSAAARCWTAAVLYFFYLATSEWCHCQPDTWMLLPALVALSIRQVRLALLLRAQPIPAPRLLFGLEEGICWGAAFLIKPFVAVPALACLALGGLVVARTGERNRAGPLALDAVFVLIGGLLVGGVAALWLKISGSWPYFMDAVLGSWNAEYFQRSSDWGQRAFQAFHTFWQWDLLHLIALPVAIWSVVETLRPGPEGKPKAGLLGVFYIGWWLQANFLQQQYDYQVVPCVFLAVAVLASPVSGLIAARPVLTTALSILTVWFAYYHPLCDACRVALWARCWREGSTPELKDALGLDKRFDKNFWAPGWVELEQVAEYLRSQGVRDHELICYSLSTLPLYLQLNIEPGTRFVMLYPIVSFFRSHWDEVGREISASPQRFIVSDLRELGVRAEFASQERPGQPLALPPGLPPSFRGTRFGQQYPWSEPIVFRAGRYLVHRYDRMPK